MFFFSFLFSLYWNFCSELEKEMVFISTVKEVITEELSKNIYLAGRVDRIYGPTKQG